MLRLDLPGPDGSVERVERWATVKMGRQGLAERPRSPAEVARRQGGVVRRSDHLRVACERRGSRVGLVREHIEAGAGEASFVERYEERGLVDQRASSDVHESRGGAHRRKRGAVDQWRASWFVA